MTHKINRRSVWPRRSTLLDTIFKHSALVLLVLLLLPPLLSADIYRCKSASGVVTYSDEPCGDDAEVAFENRAMGVEEAAGRTILGTNTSRVAYDNIAKDILAHAKQIGSCILPDQKLNGFTINRSGSTYDAQNWTVVMQFGANESESHCEVKICYEGSFKYDRSTRLETLNTLRLKSIKTRKDENSFNPVSMKKLRTFRKIQVGEWEYLGQ